MENDFRNYQNVSTKVVKALPPNFTRTVKTSKGGGRGHTRDSVSVQKIDKVSSISSSSSSSNSHVTSAVNYAPVNKQSTIRVDEAVTLGEMPCSKDTASQQQALHVGHHGVDLAAMTNKSQKMFARLPGLSNPLLRGLSSGDCDKTSKTDLASLSFANKAQGQQHKSLNYDVGHVFGDMSVGGAKPNQAVNNTSSSSNNLFFRASPNTLEVPVDMTGTCQSSAPNTYSSSFADISHQNTAESIKTNNFCDNSNTQNVNCKMILSGTGRETSIPVSRSLAQPTANDQPISTGECPKQNLPSTSNPCRMETNTKLSIVITDPERLALIKQRKRERKFRKLQSLSALMRAPDDRHSMVQLNPLGRDRSTQENLKQESGGNHSSNSTTSSKHGGITQNPFNWMPSSADISATAEAGMNFEKKLWRTDTVKKTCSFFHEPSLRNNSVLSENFSEMTKNRADYKTEKKFNDSGSNSWQLHNSGVDDALRVAALKHIKNESPLEDHLLLSASGKLLDMNSSNKRILENFLTPRVKKDDSGSESSSSVSSEEGNSLFPKIKGLDCKEKMWGRSGKNHRSQSKVGGNKFKNGETDSSSLDQFRSALANNYQKRKRNSVDYKASEENSDKSNNTSEEETDNDSDNNSDDDDDDNNKSRSTKSFGNVKRKSYKAGVKKRGRPPLSDKYKSQSQKTAKRRGRPPLMSNFGKGEAQSKQTKVEKPTVMELDTKPLLKSKDDTADNKIPKRRGRPPKKVINPASASSSPTPMSIDTPSPAMALSSLNAPGMVDAPNSVDISPTSPSELTSEEILKARLNLPRRRGRPSKVDVMLREMAAAHLAAGQPMALPTPEAVAAALAQTTEVPAKKKKVYARRRYHAYGQRKRRRRKITGLLRTLSTAAAEFDAEAEGGASELAEGEEGVSGIDGVDLHRTAYDEVEEADDDDEEEEEDEEDEEEVGENMAEKTELYRDGESRPRGEEAHMNKRHCTDRHHRRHRHHHHHHQLQEPHGHNDNGNNNDNNNNNSLHRQLPFSPTLSTSSSSSPLPLPSSSNIAVSLGQLSRHAEPAGEEQQLEAKPNPKKKQKKRKKDAAGGGGGGGPAKKQRSGEAVSGTSVGSSISSGGGGSSSSSNNNNNNNSVKEVVAEDEGEEESVLLANGNTFRVKMMKSKPSGGGGAKAPAPAFADPKGSKKDVGVERGAEENRPAAPAAGTAVAHAHPAEKPKSRSKKSGPSSSFSSSSTKAGVIKISRSNNSNNKKTNSSSSSSSSTTTTTTTSTSGSAARQIAPPVYNVPRVMLPPCIKDDGIACQMCGRVHTQDHFFKYMELKSTETSHRCPLCGQFFSWSCLFIEHMRGHPENTAQYRCEYCGSVSRKISSYFNCRITHCPPSQEWFDLQKACDDYLASLENKSSSAAAKKRRKAAAVSSASPSTKKKGAGGEGGGEGNSGGGGRGRKKPSGKQQEKDGAEASVEKTQSSNASQQPNSSDGSGGANNGKRKGQKQSKGRRSSADTKAAAKSTKTFVCNVCQKSFLNLKLFTKHNELHKTETTMNWCKNCNKQFANLTYLNSHKCSQNTAEGTVEVTNVVCRDSNSEGIGVAADNSNSCSSDINFKCSFCGAVFPDAVAHKSHVDLCEGLNDSKRLLGPHKCSICERSFKFKQSLLNHMRRHTGERPFVCELCDKTFMQAGNLERHRRTHERDTPSQSPVEKSDEKPSFTCEHCEKVFAVEATYQVHLKVHSSEQLYCPYCDEQFPSRHLLKLHKRTHNEHRPFKCSTCSRCYKHKHSLVEHQHKCR